MKEVIKIGVMTDLNKANIYSMKKVIDIINVMDEIQLKKTIQFCQDKLEDIQDGRTKRV